MTWLPSPARRLANAALAGIVVAMVGAMLVPLPTALLDLLLTLNLSLAILILIAALYATRAIELSAFPTLLLVTTLYRLVLNVSTTRLILLRADAGEVVRSFGDFVVQGNYVVGGVVFAIITLVQFVVIAKGSERVAEVGARFALDAMPGKQMSIDGEQRSGAISREEATVRRVALQRESELYGAMDGAMKFVKGDAIAGLVIIVVNLLGGLAIGVLTRDLSIQDALQEYGLLTIGDGLVSQIPALLISTAAGVAVTRVSSEDEAGSLAADLAEQLLGQPRTLYVAAGFLGVMALIPGLPTLPFVTVGVILAGAAYWIGRQKPRALVRETPDGVGQGADGAVLVVEADPTTLESFSRPLLDEHLPRLRERLLEERGLLLPPVGIRPRPKPGFAVVLHGAPVVDQPLDRHLPRPQQATLVSDTLSDVVQRYADQWVDMQVVQSMLERLARHRPAAVQECVPHRIDLPTLTAVVRHLVAERVRLRPFERLLEAVAAAQTKNVKLLIETARRSLRRTLTSDLLEDGVLPVHTLDPMIEDAVHDAIRENENESYLALHPELAAEIITALKHHQAEGPSGIAQTASPCPQASRGAATRNRGIELFRD